MDKQNIKPYMKDLNEAQIKAVCHVEGPLFVVAGAGSGKTKTLTSRIAYLVDEIGINPNSILAVTFTNKAAEEMKERVIRLVDQSASAVWIYTFHALGVQILRKDIELLKIGYKRNFNIIDEDDAKTIVKDAIKQLNLDVKKYRVNDLKAKISKFKHFGMDLFDDFNEKNIYEKYTQMLIKENLLDFDDLIVLTYELLSTIKEVREYYQNKFNYILVDEFQDTDKLQYLILTLITGKHKNLFVVGDPDQSIYGFRGADYENAARFKQEYGNERVLDINYRSTQEILDYANRLIKNNFHRPYAKELKSNSGVGILPIIAHGENDFNEAIIIGNEIKRLTNDLGYSYEDIVVLYRNNALSRVLEDTFIKLSIPYMIFGGLSFYQRREIKDILSYIRLANDTSLSFYLKRIINVPRRGLGSTTVLKLEQHANENNMTMFDAIDSIDLPVRTKDSLLEFKALINKLKDMIAQATDLGVVVDQVADITGYIQMLKDEKDDISLDRIDNINELSSVFLLGEKHYEGTTQEKLTQLLDQISLYTDLDQNITGPKVKLSTVHQVKGLEFKVVFISALEEGIFPSIRSMIQPVDIEEERRVAYVAVTRAKERLYITYSNTRLLYGQYMNCQPSRFIREMIPSNTVVTNYSDNDDKKVVKKDPVMTNTYLKVGDKVVHQYFGKGVVIAVVDGVATIAFSVEYGVKKILENHPAIRLEGE